MNNTDKYYRPPGQMERLGYFFITTNTYEVSLSANMTHSFSKALGNRTTMTSQFRNSGRTTCLIWQTQFGTKSATLTRVMHNPAGSQSWKDVSTNIPCMKGGFGQFTIKNGDRPQVLRINYTRPRGPVSSGLLAGGTQSVCRDCDELPAFDTISNFDAIRATGIRKVLLGLAAAVAALIPFIGTATSLGFLYEMGRVIMPTGRANKVRQAVRAAKAGSTFDHTSTHDYNDLSSNTFRQQQDVDDMGDLTREIKKQTEELRKHAARLNSIKDAEISEKAQLLREYEATIQRVKALQEELKKKERSR